jgi:ABC-type maltose transport system permease subunit
MIEGARWRRWVFFHIPLLLFIVFLLFPFYWMIVTTVRPDSELYRPWNAANYSPFWTFHPTLEHVTDLLTEVDMLLLMTVEPGFGGQPFLDMVLPKLRRARALVGGRDAAVWLQVDGGVSEETIERCAEAGADVFVAGSAVYGSDDPGRAVHALRAQAERATAHAAWARQVG